MHAVWRDDLGASGTELLFNIYVDDIVREGKLWVAPGIKVNNRTHVSTCVHAVLRIIKNHTVNDISLIVVWYSGKQNTRHQLSH